MTAQGAKDLFDDIVVRYDIRTLRRNAGYASGKVYFNINSRYTRTWDRTNQSTGLVQISLDFINDNDKDAVEYLLKHALAHLITSPFYAPHSSMFYTNLGKLGGIPKFKAMARRYKYVCPNCGRVYDWRGYCGECRLRYNKKVNLKRTEEFITVMSRAKY